MAKLAKWLDVPRPPAWIPALYKAADAEALKACWGGEANPGQQRRAMEWIIEKAGAYGELSFRSDRDGGDRETAFAQGRWSVAQQIQKLIGLDGRLIAKLREIDDGGPTEPGKRDKHDKSGS